MYMYLHSINLFVGIAFISTLCIKNAFQWTNKSISLTFPQFNKQILIYGFFFYNWWQCVPFIFSLNTFWIKIVSEKDDKYDTCMDISFLCNFTQS